MIMKSIQTAAKKMMIDFEELTSNIHHNGEKGTSREELVVKYLKDYIPDKYNIGRGTIIDSFGIQSRQQDIIICDSFSSPILLNMESTKMIPIESVYSTVEVKSSLNKTELSKSILNVKSVRSLSKCPVFPIYSPTIGIVLRLPQIQAWKHYWVI